MTDALSLLWAGVSDVSRRLAETTAAIRPALSWPAHCYRSWCERQALMRLDDRMLKDIGLSRSDVDREAKRSFFDPPPMKRVRRHGWTRRSN